MLFRFLFGDDVFISYSRRDGANYAAALANELSKREHGFSCFLDQWGASASSELSGPVLRALKRSSVLVLIGTASAAESPMVREEVRRFSEKRRLRPPRPVLPVNINGALDRVSWSELTGLHRTVETEEARTDGLPSESVVRLISNSHIFARRNQRVRWLSIGAAVLLVASAVASAAAVVQRQRAIAEAKTAEVNKKNADASAREAGQKADEARRSEQKAREQTALALDNARRADQQRRLTEAQTAVAQGRLLAARANLDREQQPNLLSRSVLLAVEGMRKVPSPETERALRAGVNLLALPVANFRHVDDDAIALAFSPNGERLATAGRARALRVWQVETGNAFESSTMYEQAFGPVAAAVLSPNLEWFAAATRDGVRVWNLSTGALAGAPIRRGREITAIALSADGSRVAVGTANTLGIWDVRRSAVLMNLAIDQPELSGNINAVAFSPDGTRLASARRQLAQVWDAATGTLIKSLAHRGAVRGLAFSSKGTYLATASSGITVWKPETGDSIATLDVPGRDWTFAWSPDERLLAAAAKEEAATKLWKLDDFNDVGVFVHGAGVASITFSPDGTRLLTGSVDGTARMWDVADRREIFRIPHGEGVQRVSFSPDGRRVATAGATATRVWDAGSFADGAPIAYSDFGASVAFGPRGAYLASVTKSGHEVWDAVSGNVTRHASGKSVKSLALSPDGRYLAMVSNEDISDAHDNVVRVIDPASGREVVRLVHDGARNWDAIEGDETANGVAYRVYRPELDALKRGGSVEVKGFSPDARYVVTTCIENAHRLMRVWDISGGREVSRFEYPYSSSLAVRFSPDGALLATSIVARGAAVDSTALRVWRLRDGTELDHLRRSGEYAPSFSADGRFMSTASVHKRVGTMTTWDVSNGRRISSFQGQDGFRDPEISPDGRHLLTRDVAGFAHLHETATGKEVPIPGVLDGPAIFSANGRFLATARHDYKARDWQITVWDAARWTAIASFRQEPRVRDVAFSPDARYVASASGDADDAVRIWDVAEGREISGVTVREPVWAVSFSPDGRHLVTAPRDRPARVWLWRSEDLIAAACARLTVSLTPEDWRRFFPNEPARSTCGAKQSESLR